MLQIIPLIYFIAPLFAQDYCDAEDAALCGNNFFVGEIQPGNVPSVDPVTVDLSESYLCFQTELFLTNVGCKLADLVHCGELGEANTCGAQLINMRDFVTFYDGETYEYGGTSTDSPILEGADGFDIYQTTNSLWATENNLITTSNEGINGFRGIIEFASLNDDGTANFAAYMSFFFTGECDDDDDDSSDSSDDSSAGLFGYFLALVDNNNMDKDNIDNGMSHDLVVDVSTKTIVLTWIFIGIVGFFIFGACLFYYKKQRKY